MREEVVELKMSEKYEEYADMIKRETLVLITKRRITDKNDINKLAFLKNKLEKVGVDLELMRYDDDKSDVLCITIDCETFDRMTNRGAGRKKDYDMSSKYKKCTVSELKSKLDSGMKKSEIIKELGCPKATFYRILKNVDWEDKNASIWRYTS